MLDKKAYTEANCIVKLLPDELRCKIPGKIMKNIEKNMDRSYKFDVSEKNVETIPILPDTQKILSVIYTDYLSTAEEKDVILFKEKLLANK